MARTKEQEYINFVEQKNELHLLFLLTHTNLVTTVGQLHESHMGFTAASSLGSNPFILGQNGDLTETVRRPQLAGLQ